MSTFTFVLMILVITVVAPIWIIFHYITLWKKMKPRDSDENGVQDSDLRSLAETARKLDDRVQTLEKLLDAEAPGWRNK